MREPKNVVDKESFLGGLILINKKRASKNMNKKLTSGSLNLP